MQDKRLKHSLKKIMLILLLLFLVNGLTIDQLQADEDEIAEYIKRLNETPEYQQDIQESSLMKSLIKMFIGLAVVLLLAVILLKASKKYLSMKNETGWLKVLAIDSIGPNKNVCIVKIGQKTLVLGVTEQNINKLIELSAEEVDEMELATLADSIDKDADNNSVAKQRMSFGFHEHLEKSVKRIQVLNREIKKSAKGDGRSG